MEYIESIEYRGMRIEIAYDDLAEGPRAWDNLGTMVCFHRRYNLGDDLEMSYPKLKHENFSGWGTLRSYLEKDLKAAVILPLYMYDHSGLTISTSPFSCPWDSGQIGYIFVTREKVAKEYQVKKITKKLLKKCEEALKGEVKIYDQFLTGEVYYYMIVDAEGETVDSCGGYYGRDWEDNKLLSSAKSMIDSVLEKREKRKREEREGTAETITKAIYG